MKKVAIMVFFILLGCFCLSGVASAEEDYAKNLAALSKNWAPTTFLELVYKVDSKTNRGRIEEGKYHFDVQQIVKDPDAIDKVIKPDWIDELTQDLKKIGMVVQGINKHLKKLAPEEERIFIEELKKKLKELKALIVIREEVE